MLIKDNPPQNLFGSFESIQKFKDRIYEHYYTYARTLPWRYTENPYLIFVSEFMLQQTQVERVLGKYPLFIEAFPDFQTLAMASLKDVLSIWQGLGYNRRAVSLWKAAQKVMKDHQGQLPDREEDLILLPGIGHATAGAIVAFVFDKPAVFIETNIRRVFINFFFKDRIEVKDREIFPLVEATLDRDNPRQWYYALMDYGAMLGRHSLNPNRRSAHYKKQPPFEGSDRQVRGDVIRALLEHGALSKKKLSALLGANAGRMERILAGMERDGVIVHRGKVFMFP